MTTTTPTERLLLSAREAAQALNICERKLWDLTNRGGLPCVRVGRRVLYSPDDLRRWIKTCKEGGAL